ncbi:hypothetical protein BTN49_1078 [Candidatus Enterovibrio escicola]|uniref:Uncharacterized protein n=1 Tax=Candidatus Enterovibrio escicola TaxID=1927127 RepID=A0A2A5T4J3_9GAMM|nr:hypothetical protein BTN49_1078 [Candidatus Enterovibrio escacola]
MFIILNIFRKASDVVVVLTPDESVTAIMGCFANITYPNNFNKDVKQLSGC